MLEKTQQTIFVSEVLPSLFHSSPEEFLHYLAQDGNKFLRFYWEQAGASLKDREPAAPLGLNYDIRTPDDQTTVVLIALPPPNAEPEAYYAALVYRPQRRMLLFGISEYHESPGARAGQGSGRRNEYAAAGVVAQADRRSAGDRDAAQAGSVLRFRPRAAVIGDD